MIQQEKDLVWSKTLKAYGKVTKTQANQFRLERFGSQTVMSTKDTTKTGSSQARESSLWLQMVSHTKEFGKITHLKMEKCPMKKVSLIKTRGLPCFQEKRMNSKIIW
jgi:hypothetical protein